jgi:hypothetical protein
MARSGIGDGDEKVLQVTVDEIIEAAESSGRLGHGFRHPNNKTK